MVWHQEELVMITKNMKIEISTGLEARPGMNLATARMAIIMPIVRIMRQAG